jgi:radical SAM protein with 4Fe4S-binding SPASM domain
MGETIEMGKGVLVLTYACNLKCSFCYAGYEVFGKPKTMRLAEAKAAIDFMASLGIRTFTLLGGEPTIHRDLLDVVRYAAGRQMGPWIVTNGVKIADLGFAESLVSAGLKGGCISLHGDNAEQHDAVTGIPGSFDKAMRATALAVQRGWPLHPMITVMDPTLPQVRPMIDHLIGLGCTDIYVNYGLPNIKSELDTGVDSGPEALARLTEELFHQQREWGVRFIFNREKNKIPLCHFDYDTLKDMFSESVIGVGCEASEGNTVVIEPGGKVLGCSHWVDHPVMTIFKDYERLETLTAEEFWQQWMSGKPLAYRQDLRYFPYEECAACGWREAKMCFGGCKVWQEAGALPKTIAFDGDRIDRYEGAPASPAPERRKLIPLTVVSSRPFQPR